MNNPAATTPPTTPTTGGARSTSSSIALIALALALLAIVASAIAWWDASAQKQDMTQLFGGKIAELDKQTREITSRNDALLRDMRDNQNRLAQLQLTLGELQNQRVAIEELTRDLARAPEDWLLADIEQTLNIASRELSLAGNVRGAIAALQTADQRLARTDKLQTAPLRRAITQDLERLKATPAVDTPGIIVKLDLLMTQSALLPMAVPSSFKQVTPSVIDNAKATNWFSQAWRDFYIEMKDLVRIREISSEEATLITPQQSSFVRDSLKLRLLSARTSLLARDDLNFKADIKAARDLITKYFDPKAASNQNVIAVLKQLGDNTVMIAAPDISLSMSAIRDLRTLRESREARTNRASR